MGIRDFVLCIVFLSAAILSGGIALSAEGVREPFTTVGFTCDKVAGTPNICNVTGYITNNTDYVYDDPDFVVFYHNAEGRVVASTRVSAKMISPFQSIEFSGRVNSACSEIVGTQVALRNYKKHYR